MELDLPMEPQRVFANPKVRADRGRVALRHGPLVYCLEQVDNPAAALPEFALPRAGALTARLRRDLFGGAVVIEGEGATSAQDDWGRDLYRTAPPTVQKATLTAIPYFLWANRGLGPMAVWLREC